MAMNVRLVGYYQALSRSGETHEHRRDAKDAGRWRRQILWRLRELDANFSRIPGPPAALVGIFGEFNTPQQHFVIRNK